MNNMIKIQDLLELPFNVNVYMKDIKGVYQECNITQAENFGVTNIDDVIGKKETQLHPVKNDCFLCRENDLEVVTTGKPKIFIEPITFINKPTINMISYKIPCYNNAGKIIGVFGVSSPKDIPLVSSTGIPISDANVLQSSLTSKVTKREKECLDYLMKGLTAKHIARKLNLSPRTIEFYIENMKKKFDCSNRTQLIAKALKL